MIILVGNLKGGTGKSTIAFNLAVWSSYQQRKTLLVDADPQRTTANLIEIRKQEGHQPLIYSHTAEETNLAHELGKIKDIFEDIIVDIAAGDRIGFRASLRVADKVLVPVLPGQSDVWALQNVLDIIDEEKKDRPDLDVRAVINKADTNGQVKETQETQQALEELGMTTTKARLHYRIIYRRSLTEGLGVGEWDDKSKAAKEIDSLASELLL